MQGSTVSAVTVTYGDRWALLARVLARLQAHPKIDRVIVIDNGAHVPVAPLVRQASIGKAIVVRTPRNLGSAAGFKLGIETALAEDPTWIWLLDDDNLPDPGALDLIHRSAAGLDPAECGLTAFAAFRPEHHVAVAAGEDVRRCFPPHSSFCGFHVGDIPHKIWRRLHRRAAARREIPARISLPYAPYGGLFFHRDLLKRIGTPKQELVLYADDTEFSSRIVQSGGRLWLLTGAPIVELEPSWSTKERARTSFEAWLTGGGDFRVFYRARNRAYFDSRIWSRNQAIYRLNRLVYLLTLRLFALRHHRVERYGLFRRAIARGEEGRLGLEDEFPLP